MRTASVVWMLVAAVMLLPLMVAIADGRQTTEGKGWEAPAGAASKPNPLAGRTDLAAGGGVVFARRCALCHGDDGRGTRRAPALADSGTQAQSDGALFWKIGSGDTRRGMPSFSYLPEAQRWQLVLHLRALAAAGR